MKRSAAFVILLTASWLHAETADFRLFGSAGNEAHVTPGNSQSRLNPGNFLDVAPLSNSIDVNLFGEWVPEDKTWKFDFKLRGTNDWTRARSVWKGELSELKYSRSLAPWLDVQVGRSIEKWGTGYAWNPTGVVNPRKNPSDPNDRRGAYQGVDNIKVDLLVHDWNITVLGVPEIDWNRRQGKTVAAAGWAARAYRLISGLDLSLSASGGSALPNSEGISLAYVLGKALELHGEAAAFQDGVRYRPAGTSWMLSRSRHVELLAGGQYTFPHNINVVLEYYHSGSGLQLSEWRAFGDMVRGGAEELNRGNPLPLLIDNAHYAVLSMGQNYAFGRFYCLFHHDRLEAEVLVLTSLRDGSALVRPGIYWKLHPSWSLYWLQGELLGGAATEFGDLQVSRVSDFGLRYYF